MDDDLMIFSGFDHAVSGFLDYLWGILCYEHQVISDVKVKGRESYVSPGDVLRICLWPM